MATKINLQQLAKTLAQKRNLPQKDAEAFLKTFFDAIIENVTADKMVKIKGLGTFKLIEVLDRESVNINTGERIVIPGHSKLSFTPENALKDLINKPFADFQTVVINEGTSIEEMEKIPASSPEATPVQAFVSTLEAVPEVKEEPKEDAVPEPEVKEEPKEEAVPEPEVKAEPDPVVVPEPTPEPVVVSEAKAEPESEAESAPVQQLAQESIDQRPLLYGPPPVIKKPARSYTKIAAWILGVLLLCVVGYFIARSLNTNKPAPEPVEPQVETPVEETPEPEVEYAQVPGGEYKIVGTRKTYVMKPGDFVTRIAIQEYGDKDIAPYIIVHNAFPDPDNVPVGEEIKLPELEKIE